MNKDCVPTPLATEVKTQKAIEVNGKPSCFRNFLRGKCNEKRHSALGCKYEPDCRYTTNTNDPCNCKYNHRCRGSRKHAQNLFLITKLPENTKNCYFYKIFEGERSK